MEDIEKKVERLEKIVRILSRGILLHEYGKDLCRGGVEDSLMESASDR